jgi:xylan 1,4-beta-xylosidase
MRYQNPVIAGFHPDPSICRVGEDYYLVTSSFEYFPGVPVFHSRDLVHWRQIGHCLTRPGQLPLEGARSSGGIFAPTIRHHQGRFYMITTNVTGGGHFYVHTHDPAGEWSDPVWLPGGGIDPSLFFDEDGQVFFTYTAGGMIVQRLLDLQTGRVGPERPIWGGTGGQFPEAPHLYRIGGTYYLLISEGGTEYGHMLTIARASDPWGPYEECPHNPILTHRSYFSPIQATGHGDFVQDSLGRWWVVFLGIRPNGHWPCHHLGRETFLAPLTWAEDGWPVIGLDGRAALEMEGPDLPLNPWLPEPYRDDFDSPTPRLSWNFLRNPRSEDWSLTARPGWLQLWGSEVGLDVVGSPAWLGRRQEHFDVRAAARLEFDPQGENEEAGLTAWMNERHHYELAVTLREGRRQVVLRKRIGSLASEVACHPLASGPVTLVIQADKDCYTFLAEQESGGPIEVGAAPTRYLATEVSGGFTGVYFALYATGSGSRCAQPAFFDWFDYQRI